MPTFWKKIVDGQVLLVAAVGEENTELRYTALLDTGAQQTMISPGSRIS